MNTELSRIDLFIYIAFTAMLFGHGWKAFVVLFTLDCVVFAIRNRDKTIPQLMRGA
jgi:hypothetical protein